MQMIMLNYIKPNIVIYSDTMINAQVTITGMQGKKYLHKIINNQSMIMIDVSGKHLPDKILVMVETDKNIVQKTFQR